MTEEQYDKFKSDNKVSTLSAWTGDYVQDLRGHLLLADLSVALQHVVHSFGIHLSSSLIILDSGGFPRT